MDALSDFLHQLIYERDVLLDAVQQDANSLEYAGYVSRHRRNPPTAEQIAKWESDLRLKHDLPSDHPIEFGDPETYLLPRKIPNYEDIPPQTTEHDVARFEWREGLRAGFQPAAPRTTEVVNVFRPRYGFSKLHELMRAAREEARARGESGILSPLFDAVYEAHEQLLQAAERAADRGDNQIPEVWGEWNTLVNKLMKYIPTADFDNAPADQNAPPINTDGLAVVLNQVAAFGSPETNQIMGIANNGSLNSDEKMRRICAIESIYFQHDSLKWSKLLGVSDAAIRQTQFWKVDRKDSIAQARELFQAEHPKDDLPPWLK